jgi:phosphate-selective porin OprO/OprP
LEGLVRTLQAQQAATQPVVIQPGATPAVYATQPATVSPPAAASVSELLSDSTSAPLSGGNAGTGGSTAGGPGIGGATYSGPSPSSRPQEAVPFGLPEGQVAGWNNGFFIQSPDREYIFRLTGQIQTDYRGFTNSRDTTDIDQFLLRRARFGLEANIAQYYEFRFLPDFAQGKTTIQDCYMNVHYWDELQFQVGKFKQPVSYEQLIQDRYVPTMERSIIDQLVPARDIGVMVHGQNLVDQRFDYAFGVFNGEINGDGDTNQSPDIAARLALRPFAGDSMPIWLRYAQLGVSGTFGQENEPMSPTGLRTPDTVSFLAWNVGTRAYGTRTRLIPEYSYICGPFGFYAQYLTMDQDILGGAAKAKVERVPFDGWVLFGSVLLTGETRTSYNEQLAPLVPLDVRKPFQCPGAWEFVVRMSQLHVGDQVFTPGANQLADPTKYANQATEFMVGFNWYWNAWVRVQFNAEHDHFNDPVLLGTTRPSGLLNNQNSLFTRLQIIF